MPRIFPFRGIHFDPARVGDLTQVTSQPYDRIGPDLQQEYYRRNEHNICRIIQRKSENGADKYAAAAATLDAWLKEGILARDAEPCFYAYFQTYSTPQGPVTRKGFAALVNIEEPGKGMILPHEQTHTGPKVDRLNLIRATQTHTEPIFFVYSDPKKTADAILEEVSKRPADFQAKDDLGETHRVWRISDPGQVRALQEALEDKVCIIADGHHRYETSWNYRKEMEAQGRKAGGPECFRNVLATLVNTEGDLTIFGSHRIVEGLKDFDPARMVAEAKKVFEVREYPFKDDAEERGARKEMLEDLRVEGLTLPCFGVAARGASAHYLFIVRDVKAAAARVKDDRSEAWRSLDVNLLHAVVMDGMLGVGPEQMAAEENVTFHRSADVAVEKTREEGGPVQVSFLVNPVKLEQIREIAGQGERFPQKSTDFYPKLLTGLLLCRLDQVS